MTGQVLFVQGAGPRVHDEWDDKLVASLTRALGPDFDVRYPRMPGEDDPKADEWKATLQNELRELRDGAIVVGHSVGGAILIDTVAEQPPPRPLGAIVLISAPFFGEGGWPADDLRPSDELRERLPRGVPIHLYHGLADEEVPPAHAELYARVIPHATLHRLPGRDHQLNADLREVAEDIRALADARAAERRSG